MIYLEKFKFPTEHEEWSFFMSEKLNCYSSYYPFQILSKRGLSQLDFEKVTILTGSNGSGKSTALNIIAEKLRLTRDSVYIYQQYVDLCTPYLAESLAPQSRIITSDDVFDYMLDLRCLNQGIDLNRENVFDEYSEFKHSDKYYGYKLKGLDDYDTFRKVVKAKNKTNSAYTRSEATANVREHSNGESAFKYFADKITDGGLYLLEHPDKTRNFSKFGE